MKYKDYIKESSENKLMNALKRETEIVLKLIKSLMPDMLNDTSFAEDNEHGFKVNFGLSQQQIIEEIKDYISDVKDEYDWCLFDIIDNQNHLNVIYQNKENFYMVPIFIYYEYDGENPPCFNVWADYSKSGKIDYEKEK